MGYALCLLKAGYCYNCGIGTSVNYQKAFELYQQAESLGNIVAQYNLNKYYIGKGVEQTLALYHQAANSGYNLAQYKIGRLYEYGIVIKKDIKQAIY
ncbi:uncharacterized protein OCT59_007102 [Rhizophagus irregularis]|nr:hypothetical protein RirG_004950 [Rhizophagus irregularis DAOM 197198w]UZO15685.1 hypothetical protein OCT59_007102 [Rhizophagus irregularis]